MIYDMIIIGAGPAGMTAALYALRAEKKVLLLDGNGYGGQITQSREVENYPGIANVNGMDLAEALMSQINALGVDFQFAQVSGIVQNGEIFSVNADAASYEGRSVIVATGLKHRKLGVAGEEQYIGRGVSFCAVCDGAFFRRREVAVVGGGNTAVQDALFLSEICSKVYLIHRREGFRAEESLLTKAKSAENIEIITNTTVSEIRGEMLLRSLLLKNKVTGEERELEVSGVFEAVGLEPQNKLLEGLITLAEDGYVAAGEDCKTNVAGIFVAGDCRSKQIRQLTTATADGTVAALAALDYLDRN